jgi:hypothetical protein
VTDHGDAADEIRLHQACDWLHRTFKATRGQGFSIGFDLRRGWLAPYAETTGYIIPTFYRYAQRYDRPEFANIATAAAEWLVGIQSPDGWFPDFIGTSRNFKPREPVVFNTGQDLFGLLAAYRVLGDRRFLDAAEKAATWLVEVQSPDGRWLNPGFGAAESAAYYTRVTWPILLVAQEAGRDDLASAATRGLQAIAAKVRENDTVAGWNFSADKTAFTHTIAYTVEGMLFQSRLRPDTRPLSDTARGIASRLVDILRDRGRFAGAYDMEWRGESWYTCNPGNCQLALIFWSISQEDDDPKWAWAAERSLSQIINAQRTGRMVPSVVRGALPASTPPVVGRYLRWLYPNWGAKYLADALMYRLALARGQVDSMERLLSHIPG